MIASRAIRPFAGFIFALALACGLLAAGPAASAPLQQAKPTPRLVTGQPLTVREVPAQPNPGAEQVRDELTRTLEQYPPSLGRVLKSDPTLLDNPSYLAAYPAFTAFLAAHPEIRRDPAYFFAQVRMGTASEYYRVTPEQEALEAWRSALGGLAILFVFVFITGAVVWLVKTLVEQRRWSRATRAQTDFQAKLFDRLSSNQDLAAWLDTPAGKRLLDVAPLAAPAALPEDGGHPVRRILWAMQAGVVLLALGIGLEYVSPRVLKSVAEPLFALGVVAIALGAGFIVSALVSLVLSRQLGVLAPAARHAGDRGQE